MIKVKDNPIRTRIDQSAAILRFTKDAVVHLSFYTIRRSFTVISSFNSNHRGTQRFRYPYCLDHSCIKWEKSNTPYLSCNTLKTCVLCSDSVDLSTVTNVLWDYWGTDIWTIEITKLAEKRTHCNKRVYSIADSRGYHQSDKNDHRSSIVA